jgi:hypothetical protein
MGQAELPVRLGEVRVSQKLQRGLDHFRMNVSAVDAGDFASLELIAYSVLLESLVDILKAIGRRLRHSISSKLAAIELGPGLHGKAADFNKTQHSIKVG